MTDDRRWISGGQPLTRVAAKIAPAPAPWDVLTADMARELADVIWRNAQEVWWLDDDDAVVLLAYADAVDALTHSWNQSGL